MPSKDSKAKSNSNKKVKIKHGAISYKKKSDSSIEELRAEPKINDSQVESYLDDEAVTNSMLNRIFCRVRQIKQNYPDLSAEIDMHEWMLKLRLGEIKETIKKLPEEESELVTILVVSGIRLMIDELLDIKHEEIKDIDARDIDLHKTQKLRRKIK